LASPSSFSSRSPLGTIGGDFFHSMVCPFDNDPVDESATLLRRELNIHREMVIRPRIDVLAFPDNHLFSPSEPVGTKEKKT